MFGNYIYTETGNGMKGDFSMRAKILICAGMILGLVIAGAAAEKKEPAPAKPEYTFVKTFTSNADPEKYPDPAKAAELLMQREKLVRSLHEEKRNVIRNDAQARALQKEIKERLVKLTQLVERNESVKRINKEIRALDEQLKNLPPPPPPPETENADVEKPDVQKGKEKKKNTIRRKK